MERKIFKRLLDWKHDPDRKALLLMGARQIGKTYILKEFAKSECELFVDFNLEDDRHIHELFEAKDISAERLLESLFFISYDRMIPSKSAIILDEVNDAISYRFLDFKRSRHSQG